MADTDARTPGPWVKKTIPFVEGSPHTTGIWILGAQGERVAEIFGYGSTLPWAENADAIVEACNNYDTLRSRNACLTALLELALPSVDHHSRMVGTEDGIRALDKLADDIRQALAKEMGNG